MELGLTMKNGSGEEEIRLERGREEGVREENKWHKQGKERGMKGAKQEVLFLFKGEYVQECSSLKESRHFGVPRRPLIMQGSRRPTPAVNNKHTLARSAVKERVKKGRRRR